MQRKFPHFELLEFLPKTNDLSKFLNWLEEQPLIPVVDNLCDTKMSYFSNPQIAKKIFSAWKTEN